MFRILIALMSTFLLRNYVFSQVEIDTTAPAVPTLSSPVDATTVKTGTPRFLWSLVSDTSTPVLYDIQVDNETTFSLPLIIEVTDLGTALHMPTNPLTNGTYYWRVRARDSASPPNRSIWSAHWTVTVAIDTTPPGTPTILAPANGTTQTIGTFSFLWSEVTDTESMPVSYEIQIDNDSSFTQPELSSTRNIAQYVPVSGTSLPDGTYYWRVRARDSALPNNTGAWSNVGNLTIVNQTDTIPPSVPTLISPSQNEIITKYYIPTFKWSPVTDTQNLPVNYVIRIANDTNFTNIILSFNKVTVPEYPTYQVVDPLPNGTYYWQVRAFDNVGNYSDWSSTGTFTINVTEAIVLPLYNGGFESGLRDWVQHNQAQATYTIDTTVFYAGKQSVKIAAAIPGEAHLWQATQASTVRAGSDYKFFYWIKTDTVVNQGGAGPALRLLWMDNYANKVLEEFIPGPTGTNEWTKIEVTRPAPTTPSTQNYPVGKVQVAVFLSTATGTVWFDNVNTPLDVDVSPPNIPSLFYPVNGSTSTISTPYFDWSDVSDPSTPVTYELQIDDDPGFNPVKYTWGGLTQSEFTQQSILTNGTYFWRVKARDNAAIPNTSDLSESWRVTINVTVGSDVTPPHPVNTLTVKTGSTADAVYLQWQAPGDDYASGTLTGKYAIQYMNTDGPWTRTNAQVVISTSGINPGTVSTIQLTNLNPDYTYYFSLWTADDADNWSAESNHPSIILGTGGGLTGKTKPEEKFVTKNIPAKFGSDAEEVKIYDPGGGLAVELKNTDFANNQIVWYGNDKGGKNLESGAYIYKIKTKNGKSVYGMIILAK